MTNTKNLSWLARVLFVTLSWSLISCAVTPPDVPVFEHFGQRITNDPITDHMILTPSPLCMEMIGEFECGHGVYIISGKEIWVGENKAHWFNKKSWSEIKRESLIMPAAESGAPIMQYIINSCAQNHCNDSVDRFKVQVNQFKGIGPVLRGTP